MSRHVYPQRCDYILSQAPLDTLGTFELGTVLSALHRFTFFRLTLPTMCGGNVSVRIPRPAPKRTVYERKMTCGTFFSDMFFEHFFLFFLVCKTEILPVADSRPRHANPIRCGGAMLTPLGTLPAVRAELWPHLPVIEFASLSFCSSFRVQIAQHRRTFWSLPFVGRWLRRHFRDEYRGCKGAAHGSTMCCVGSTWTQYVCTTQGFYLQQLAMEDCILGSFRFRKFRKTKIC